MKEKRVVVKVFDKDTLVDTFDSPLKVKDYIVFPDRPPYNGLKYYISSCIDGVYEFTPDGYEQFIKFSDKRIGQVIEYLEDRSYTITFQAYERN